MKKIVSYLALSLSFASASYAQNPLTMICADPLSTLELQIQDNVVLQGKISGELEYTQKTPPARGVLPDGSVKYAFVVRDMYDTKAWFDVYVKNNQIVKRELFESGNDSDNYHGHKVAEGDKAFKCE